MGVYYSAMTGYGFVLDRSELERVANQFDLLPEDDYEIGDYSADELAEAVANSVGLQYAVVGNLYSVEGEVIIGVIESTNRFGLTITKPISEVAKTRVIQAAAQLDVDIYKCYDYLGLTVF